jgi:hypothetical protein
MASGYGLHDPVGRLMPGMSQLVPDNKCIGMGVLAFGCSTRFFAEGARGERVARASFWFEVQVLPLAGFHVCLQ